MKIKMRLLGMEQGQVQILLFQRKRTKTIVFVKFLVQGRQGRLQKHAENNSIKLYFHLNKVEVYIQFPPPIGSLQTMVLKPVGHPLKFRRPFISEIKFPAYVRSIRFNLIPWRFIL